MFPGDIISQMERLIPGGDASHLVYHLPGNRPIFVKLEDYDKDRCQKFLSDLFVSDEYKKASHMGKKGLVDHVAVASRISDKDLYMLGDVINKVNIEQEIIKIGVKLKNEKGNDAAIGFFQGILDLRGKGLLDGGV